MKYTYYYRRRSKHYFLRRMLELNPDFTPRNLSELLGITYASLNAKAANRTPFTVAEIEKLLDATEKYGVTFRQLLEWQRNADTTD